MTPADDRVLQAIRRAPRSVDDLIRLMTEVLNWPFPDAHTWADIEVEWEPEELHLDPDKVAKLTKISQVPKLTQAQRVGVFILEFEGANLPVGALRRVVNQLVTAKRARTRRGEHPTWDLDDLVFICRSGAGVKMLHVVGFREVEGKRVLRVVRWGEDSTENRIELTAHRVLMDLTWQNPYGPQVHIEPSLSRHTTRGINSAALLSRHMAEVARDVRDEIHALHDVETDDGPIRSLFASVQENLLGNLTAAQFADVYAQTMVYGLLTARIAHPERFDAARGILALEFDNKFLDAIYARFRDQSESVIDADELGLADLADELARIDIDELLADFGAANHRDDPVVYFYEEFLAQYDPQQRRDLGTFYTPKPVVKYIIKTVDDTLKSFGLPKGVADATTWGEYHAARPEVAIPEGLAATDPVVSMLDPATGTGTFLAEWLNKAEELGTDEDVAAALAHSAALEISLASYAIAHLKVSLDLPKSMREARLPIHLGDTLGASRPDYQLDFGDPVSTEGALADEVKFDRQTNVVCGNPPWDRVESTGTGGFITEPNASGRSYFDDIQDDVREHVNFSQNANLYNLYVYFWRFAILKAFEQTTGPAVVSMITASSWLDGPGFLGLRRLAREHADEIIVVDLHGDNRGAHNDENIFDIETPAAIVTLIRRGNGDRSTPAVVRYASYFGTKAMKFDVLNRLAAGTADLRTSEASTRWHAPFVPGTGGADWEECPALTDLLPWQQPGCKFGRTWPIAVSRSVLDRRWRDLVTTEDLAERATAFITPSSGRNINTSVAGLPKVAGLKADAESQPIVRYGYRSFDRQYAFDDPRMAKTESPSLWASVSGKQIFLVTKTTFSLGRGPGAVASVGVPDLDSFRGSFGGKDVVPLYRDAMQNPNADGATLTKITKFHSLASTDAAPVTAERLFAYIYGVLAGTDYTSRFAEGLETPGPRVPLSADPSLFEEMLKHGEELLWLQTFGERLKNPDRKALPDLSVTWSAEPTRLPDGTSDYHYDAASETLTVANGTLTGVRPDVWAFEVSGMEVLKKWLGYRMVRPAGRAARSTSPLDAIRPHTWQKDWSAELVEIVTVLTRTLDLQPVGVDILNRIQAGPLIKASDLPEPLAALRQPPAVRRNHDHPTLGF